MPTPERAAFDRLVWQVVRAIPKGRVATYGDVAAAAGFPGYARHVGRTLQTLPPRSTVPWHRVINAQGRISARPDRVSEARQEERLRAEGVPFRGPRHLDLRRCRWAGG